MDSYLHNPVAMYVRALLGAHMTALRSAWQDRDRGASAVELAIITAIILGLAVVLLAVITRFIHKEQNKIH
jgi:Flp pilus assembly protein TadG